MGIVQRQSLKNSIVNYLGIGIGGLSTMFIYPLDWDLYGEIQFILSTSILLSSLFAMGSHTLVNKYFPYFKANKIKGFLSLLFIYSSVNILIVSILLFLFKEPFTTAISLGGFDVNKIERNLFVIFPLGILFVYFAILRAQSFNYARIVVPDVISNFSLKLLIPILVILSYFSIINDQQVGWILIIYNFLIIVLLLKYIHSLGGLDFKWNVIKKVAFGKHVEMIRYMIYGAMNHVGNILVYKIDIVMIGLLLSTTKVGYYSIFLFLSVVIEVPTKAIFQITGPIISKSFETNQLLEIRKLYKNSSINLYLIGVVLFSIIWLNINTFFTIMTNGEDLIIYKTVFLLLAFTKLVDMVTSINFHIISYSKYFRANTLFIAILAVSNILFNYYLINKYDIIGAALATGISMLLFNLMKTIFVFIQFKMHPFRKELLLLTLFLIGATLLPILFEGIFNSIFFSLIISIGFVILLIFVAFKLNISLELNNFIKKYRDKLINKK
ncbi:lipopolysaccharide biosynthesis protein [Brumimicrobium salinarum]|uniref:lipopolysaccharide biosynthesis protein n=1 Tax=Brumimicrobium salinarum TaxID=2058658 RepID=UPI0013FDCAFC|nr:polysaccharide biosynthesis C-terminal domain-containing protein [Brumimicrobium salinarum]